MNKIIWALEIWNYDRGDWSIQITDHYPKAQGQWMREWFEYFQQEEPHRPRRIKAYIRHENKPEITAKDIAEALWDTPNYYKEHRKRGTIRDRMTIMTAQDAGEQSC